MGVKETKKEIEKSLRIPKHKYPTLYRYPQKSPSYTDRGQIYKGAFHLPIQTTVYVPSTKKGQKHISAKEFKKRIDRVRKFLSRKYGGYTSVEGYGGYTDKKGKLIKEKVIRIIAFTTKEDFSKNKRAVKKQLKEWGKEWGQESIGYGYEGDLYYV